MISAPNTGNWRNCAAFSRRPHDGVDTATATTRSAGRHRSANWASEPQKFLVSSFNRPNLVYRVQTRHDLRGQIREVIDRHPRDSGLIYCIRRTDVEELSAELQAAGYQALPYHAGLADEVRQANQDAFINDRAKIIVATVAFGMGIDKSDVRYVIHAAAPSRSRTICKSRDEPGATVWRPSAACSFPRATFAPGDRMQEELPEPAFNAAVSLLGTIDGYCNGVVCRHRVLAGYFGQELESENCGACDVCLAELDLAEDPLVLGQKILSCVHRLGESFGGDYTAQVLAGAREQRILANAHDKLSTWGILQGEDRKSIRNWIEQLVSQGFLEKNGEYNVLRITPDGRHLLRGERTPRLLRPAAKRARKTSRAAQDSWEGVDRGVFETLRQYRRDKATERGQAPFILFSDATLRDLARHRPATLDELRHIRGIGDKKLADYGVDLLHLLKGEARKNAGVDD